MTECSIGDLLIGESAVMVRLRDLIVRLAPARIPVLIQGPTGSGKELVAQALHQASGRRGPYVALNVCAITDTMFEDTLFGHLRGAFTGAHTDYPGFLREADGGTAFLDEIGAISLDAQAKLLRVVETHQFRPLGARTDRTSHFRLLTATNVDLEELVTAGRFRADLRYRISSAVVVVPALSEHAEDVPALARHLAQSAGHFSGREIEVTSTACELLAARDWPGNVRQLRSVVESAVALATGLRLGCDELHAAFALSGRSVAGNGRDFERRRMSALLESVGWDTASTARELGVHRVTVYRRMRALGIELPRGAARRANAPRPDEPICAAVQPFTANECKSDAPPMTQVP